MTGGVDFPPVHLWSHSDRYVESRIHSAAMARWYDALIIATSFDVEDQPLESVGGFPERVLGFADVELNCDRLAVLVGHPEGDRGGSLLVIDLGTGRVRDHGLP
jgi:hypothetical protein